MKEFLLEIALRKSGELVKKVSESSLESLRELVVEEWNSYEPRSIVPDSFSAVDGSHNTIEFKGFTLYALAGYGAGRHKGEVYERIVGDIDILTPPGISERVQLLRETAETITAYMLGFTDLVMVDGSIRALLIHPRPLASHLVLEEVSRKTVEKLGEGFYEDYWHMVNENLEELREKNLVEEPYVSKRIIREKQLYGDEDKNIVALLEYLEKLMVLRRLIEEASMDKPRLVYVSKTSRTTLYFKREWRDKLAEENRDVVPVISDILAFTYFTHEPGYSRPIPHTETESDEKRLKHLPVYGELERIIYRFYEGLDYIITFIRLVEYGPVFKLEIPVPRNTVEKTDLDRIIRRIMDIMKGLEVGGYPYPLIEADKSSKITRRDMIVLARSLGLLPTSTGREVLVEWL